MNSILTHSQFSKRNFFIGRVLVLFLLVMGGACEASNEQSDEGKARVLTLRVGVVDERSSALSKRIRPALLLQGSKLWYPDLQLGGDMRNYTDRIIGATDTLLIFPLGRDNPAVPVMLRLTDSLCLDGCARDIVHVSLTDSMVTVVSTSIPVDSHTFSFYYGSHGKYGDPPGEYVSRVDIEQQGKQWPLTVNEGWLDCIDGKAIVFRTRRNNFAVNGAATAYSYQSISSVWKLNPDIPDARINIGPLLDLGQKICNSYK